MLAIGLLDTLPRFRHLTSVVSEIQQTVPSEKSRGLETSSYSTNRFLFHFLQPRRQKQFYLGRFQYLHTGQSELIPTIWAG